jgi:tetratricopeptide (TPR) repeat protein
MLGLTSALLLTLAGCPGESKSVPTKVEKGQPGNPAPKVQDDASKERASLRDPGIRAPIGREGAQLPEAELEATLAAAAELATLGNRVEERMTLGKCANKLPASGRCDAAMGLSLIQSKTRREAGLYYLREAAKLDDPKGDAALYAALAEALRNQGLVVEATLAQDKAVARDGSPAQRFALARILSLQPDRLIEAADLMAAVRAEQDSLAWHYEEAIVRGQIPTKEDATKAVELLEQYVAKVAALPEGDPGKTDTSALAARIAELRGLAEIYVTREVYVKALADAAAAPPGEAPLPEEAPLAPQPAPTTPPA